MNVNKIAYGLPAFITAGIIFYASSLENIELPLDQISFNDLLFHALAYFFFGITLLFAAYPWHTDFIYPRKTYLILAAIGVLYGLSDEIHQNFVPNRFFAMSDLFADSVGVILSMVAAKIWIDRKRYLVRLPGSRHLDT
jgi:VanZ family protein